MESANPENAWNQYKLKEPVLYATWLFAAWSLYVAFVYPFLDSNSSVAETLTREAFRIAIFVAPPFLFIKAPFREILRRLRVSVPTKRDWVIGIAATTLWMGLALLIATKLQNRTISGVPAVSFWLTGFTIATLAEEITFRSFFLQNLWKHGSFVALLISTLLFVAIHFPGWAILGTHSTGIRWITATVSIFVLGWVLGHLFLRTESIWPCVMLHAGNNLAAALTSAT